MKSLNLSHGNTKGIIDVCKGLSLNDSYWIVPQGFDGTFAQYNLYENRFSEILSLVAYTGVGQTHGAFSTSPELTTAGMLPKAWRLIENDGIYLQMCLTTVALSSKIVVTTSGSIAQQGEHMPYKHGVAGSSPAVPTIAKPCS